MEELNISRNDLNNYVNGIIKSGRANFMSVYIRDMNNGPWVGINEREEFIGGSLLKVPILISILKKAEDDPEFLNQKVLYDKELVSNAQYFQSDFKLEIGKEYTVDELLTYMIKYSDNNAAYILSQDLTINELNETFASLGMGKPDINIPYPVNSKTYAAFFRSLFNSSYLSKKYSEKALTLLAKVDFNRGLVRDIPSDITVAHKFGIRSEGQVNQLHDCGIVYYPKHPYLMCIMSKGNDFNKLTEAVADISGFIYKQVSKN